MDAEKTLFDLMQESIKKKYKKDLQLGSNLKAVERIPTYIAGLDYLTGGGLPLGRVIHVHGKPSTGKSALALSIALALQEQGHETFYIDLERTQTSEHIANLKTKYPQFNPNSLAVWTPDSAEEAIDSGLEALAKGYKMVVIDSVPFLYPEVEMEKIDQSSEDSLRVGMLAGFLTKVKVKITKTVEESKGILLMINHDTMNLKSSMGGWTYPGGQALKHMISLSIHLKFFRECKEGKGSIETQTEIDKAKTCRAFTEHTLMIEDGILRREASLINALLELKLLTNTGGRYKDLQGNQLAYGKPKMMEFLEDPTNFKAYYDVVLNHRFQS